MIAFGYSAGILQFVLLFLASLQKYSAYSVIAITFGCNLFIIAYLPAIKAYVAHLTKQEKGKALGQLNVIQTLGFGLGYFLGGVLYDVVGIQFMIILSVGISVIALAMVGFIPPVKIQTIKMNHDTLLQNSAEIDSTGKEKLLHHSVFNFRQALVFQFLLVIVSSSFFGLFAPYLNSLHMGTWFYGLSQFGSAILGAMVFALFGFILDKRGPDFLFWWAWISYALVYLFLLLTQNLVLIFIIWLWPAYPFFMATEYLASFNVAKDQAIRNMAKATFARSAGMVVGIILGGWIALIGGFSLAIQFALWGSVVMGVVMAIKRFFTRHGKEGVRNGF